MTVTWLVLFVANSLTVDARPNIVFILADDLNADWKNDRLSYMPHLRKRFSEGGAFFENHVAAVPVCGPSRSSFLTGRYPHNNGYLINDDLDSVEAFCGGPAAARNANNSVGRWLRDAGYYSAFLGKYVNSCEAHVPYGWSHWGGFIQTYDFYNASMYDMTWGDNGTEPERKERVMEGVHQGDFLGNMTIAHAKKALDNGRPFFIHVTPVMPHWGTCYGPGPASVYSPEDPYWEMAGVDDGTGKKRVMPISPCPSIRHAHAFDGQTNSHIPEVWNVSITGPRPKHMLSVGYLDAFDAIREDIGWRNRSAALLDLDYMLGVIMDGLEALDVLENTYVFFSSDNGYHLGEHKNVFGKGLPYETDVRLPMYVAGPTVKRNSTFLHPTTHLDITATIVDIAGARSSAPSNLDGKSFASELSGGSAEDWRQFSFSEFFMGDDSWRLVRVVNTTHTFTYTRWCTDDDTEIYDLRSDPWQTSNIAGQRGLPSVIANEFGPIGTALASCVGAACSSTEAPSIANMSFACYNFIQGKQAHQGAWNWHTSADANKVDRINGWAVDFMLDGPGTQHPRGFTALEVGLRVDGALQGAAFQQTANITREDLMKHGSGVLSRIPNPEHGFLFDLTALPPSSFTGHHHFEVVRVVRDGRSKVITGLERITQQPLVRCLCDGMPCDCLAFVV